MEYTWLSKQSYDRKHNITDRSIENTLNAFKIGSKVLYYIGDKQVAMRKWKTRWTGPWVIEKHINDSSVIITDPSTGNQKRVSFDRLKKFYSLNNIKYKELFDDDEYLKYQKKLYKRLKNYKVDVLKGKRELDYTVQKNE